MPEVVSSLGKITTGEHGQIRIGQKILDVDISDISESYETALKGTAKPIQLQLDESAKKVSALGDLKAKLVALQDAAAPLANRLQFDAPNCYDTAAVTLTSSNPTITHSSIATINVNNGANLGTFNLTVNQIASGDILKGSIASPDLSTTAFGLTGTINLGTVIPGSVQQIAFTPGMTISQIQSQINSFTTLTGVSAELAQITPGSYELRLKSTTSGTPVLLSDQVMGTVAALGLSPVASGTLAGAITTPTPTTALGLTGSVTVSSSLSGVPTMVPIINTMTLTDIVTNITAASGTTNITADYDCIYNNDGTNIYQLRLRILVPPAAANETVTISDTGGVMAALGLNKPITDWNTINAQFNCDGTNYKRSSNHVTDILAGVDVQLNSSSPSTTITGSVAFDNNIVQEQFESLIKAYNDLNSFYLKQTKFDENKQDSTKNKKSDDAILFSDPTLKLIRENVRSALSKVIPGAATDQNSLYNLGVALDKNSFLSVISSVNTANNTTITGQAVMDQFFQLPSSVIQKIFGNSSSSTNTSFSLSTLPPVLPNSLAGQTFSVMCQNVAGTISGTMTLGATVYPATVKSFGNYYTLTGPAGSPFDGVTISLKATLNNGDVQTSNMSVTQGFAALIDGAMSNALVGDPSTSPATPGLVDGRIAEITKKEEKLKKSIEKIDETAKKKGEDIRRSIEKIMPALEKFKQLDRMLDSLAEQMRKD